MRSAGSASHLEVGFDSGMMIGRSVCAAMSRTMASVNAPEWVEVPISIVGMHPRNHLGEADRPVASPAQPATSSRGRA